MFGQAIRVQNNNSGYRVNIVKAGAVFVKRRKGRTLGLRVFIEFHHPRGRCQTGSDLIRRSFY